MAYVGPEQIFEQIRLRIEIHPELIQRWTNFINVAEQTRRRRRG